MTICRRFCSRKVSHKAARCERIVGFWESSTTRYQIMVKGTDKMRRRLTGCAYLTANLINRKIVMSSSYQTITFSTSYHYVSEKVQSKASSTERTNKGTKEMPNIEGHSQPNEPRLQTTFQECHLLVFGPVDVIYARIRD
jgi:hypothetical protein